MLFGGPDKTVLFLPLPTVCSPTAIPLSLDSGDDLRSASRTLIISTLSLSLSLLWGVSNGLHSIRILRLAL